MDLVSGIETFDGLGREWHALMAQAQNPLVFMTPQWQKAWWEVFGKGRELLLLTLRRNKELIAVAPLFRENSKVTFLGDVDLCDYHDLVIKHGEPPETYRALFDALAALSWSTLELSCLQTSSITCQYFPPFARERGYAIETLPQDVCPRIALPASWEEYLESLSKKDRHELRRKLRRLSGAGEIKYYALAKPEEMNGAMNDFLHLLKISRSDKFEFLTPQIESFFNRMALALAPEGYIKLCFLEVNGSRVASVLCFDFGGEYSLYNSGYDPAYSSLSVGLLSKGFCLQEAIARKRSHFDFLRGTESYKYDLGGLDEPIYSVKVRR